MRFILRFFGFLFSIAAMLFVVGAAAGGYFYWKYSRDLPDHAAQEIGILVWTDDLESKLRAALVRSGCPDSGPTEL